MYDDTNIVSLTGRTTKEMKLSDDGKIAFVTLAINRYYKRDGDTDFTESTAYVDVAVFPAPEFSVAKGTNVEVVDAYIDAKANAYYGQEGQLFSSNRVRVHRSGFRQTASVAGSHRNIVLATGRVSSINEFDTANGNVGVSSEIAVNRSYMNNGQRQQFTTWISTVAWNDTVQRKLNTIPVGAKVFLKGYLDKTPSVPPANFERPARNRVVLTDVSMLALPRKNGQVSTEDGGQPRNGSQLTPPSQPSQVVPQQPEPKRGGLGEEVPTEYADLAW